MTASPTLPVVDLGTDLVSAEVSWRRAFFHLRDHQVPSELLRTMGAEPSGRGTRGGTRILRSPGGPSVVRRRAAPERRVRPGVARLLRSHAAALPTTHGCRTRDTRARALTRCADTHNEATLLEWAESCTGPQLEKTCPRYRRVLRCEGLIPADDPEFRYVPNRALRTRDGRWRFPAGDRTRTDGHHLVP